MLYKLSDFSKGEQLFSKADPQTLIGRIVNYPLSRIPIAILYLAPVSLLHALFEYSLLPIIPEQYQIIAKGADNLIGFVLLIFIYTIYTKTVEKRPAYELQTSGLLRDIVTGLIIGGGMMVLLIIILAVFGSFTIEAINFDPASMIGGIFNFGMAAFFEELLFRLILFKLTEELLGSWWALIINIGFFGLAHASNPNATLWTSLAVGIEAGAILSATYILTRKVWLPLALHFGWNFFQSQIFGVSISGREVKGLISSAINGPDWFTGGSFGVEGSVLAVFLCSVVSLWILKYSINLNQILQPRWLRNKKINIEE